MWSSVNARSRLVGRERELTATRRLSREHRLVTLVGPGGAGKSRLWEEPGSPLHATVVRALADHRVLGDEPRTH